MQKSVYEFISIKTNDPIIQRRICKRTGEEFPIFQSEKDLLSQISPVINGKKYEISLPSLSPSARQINRMLFRNDRVFYKWKSDHDGKWIISIYSPEFAWKVYEVNDRYKDIWDPMSYAKDANTNKPFATIGEMMLQVPRLNVDGVGNTNSDYCNYCGYDKDCYMDIAGENNEGCYYCLFTKYSKRCVDCTFVYDSEYCYESISSYNCNKIVYSQYLENCHNCYFSFDLKNCHNCLRCRNLRNQDYCILNKKVTPEEFEQELEKIMNTGYEAYLQGIQKFNEIKSQFIFPATFKIQTENSFGSDLKGVKHSKFLFNVSSEVENSLYMYDVLHAKNCCDLNYSLYQPESSYQLISTLELKKSVCNFATHHSRNVYYCQLCNNCSDCFGCSGLNNKSYCIFNKQYSKDEYEATLALLLENLISDWIRWTFFPADLSPHPYNDTVAIEYFPIGTVTSDEWVVSSNGGNIQNTWWRTVHVLEPGKFISDAWLDLWWAEKIKIKWRTKNQEVNIPENLQRIQAWELPENGVDESILDKVIICETSERPFRIQKWELEFYRKMKLPLPHKHQDIRHLNRIQLRAKRELYLRNCDKCGIEMVSVYEQEAEFKVYCEQCYNKEIYW